jgi:outer membrane protein assembly factor BamA
LSAENQEEDSYTQKAAGLELGTWYRRSFRTTFDLSAAWYYVDADFVSESEEDILGPVTLLQSHGNWDHTDDRLRPTRGTLLWVKGQWSPPVLPSEQSFVLGETGGSQYIPLPRRSVGALRLAVGVANPLGDDESLLPGLRFFAGE